MADTCDRDRKAEATLAHVERDLPMLREWFAKQGMTITRLRLLLEPDSGRRFLGIGLLIEGVHGERELPYPLDTGDRIDDGVETSRNLVQWAVEGTLAQRASLPPRLDELPS